MCVPPLSFDGRLGCFHFCLSWIMLLWTFVYKLLCGHMFSFLLVINPGEEFLGHMMTWCLAFQGTAGLFWTSYIPSNSVWRVQFFHIVTTLTFFIMAIPWVCSSISFWLWFKFPWWLMMLQIFSCACWPFLYLPQRNIYEDHLPT